MFQKKSGSTVRNVRLIKIIRLAYTNRENAELWLKVNVTTHERRRATADKSTRSSESSPKLRRSKLSGSNARFVVT
jgi:hypothetical protein